MVFLIAKNYLMLISDCWEEAAELRRNLLKNPGTAIALFPNVTTVERGDP